jgi:tetratricopeptide (TPR) repeat protein
MPATPYRPPNLAHWWARFLARSVLAFLRRSHVALLRSSVCVFVLALSPTGLVCAGEASGGPEPTETMRLPGWIHSFAESESTPATQTAGGSTDRGEKGVVAAGGVIEDAAVTLPVADWKSPQAAAVKSAAARGAASQQPSASTTPATSFRRWISDRVATLPKPTLPNPASFLPGSAAADEPPADVANTRTESAESTAVSDGTGSTLDAPVAATPDEMPTLSIDPATFHGAHPGRTTRAELEKVWGPGEPVPTDDATASWRIEPFDRVEVSFDGDTVATISIKLGEPMNIADLARQLEIADLRTVTVHDEDGTAIGEAYPERGVILSLDPESQQASAILIEPLDADAFVLRAEGELDSCSAYAVADLQYAIEIDPNHVRAHRLLLTVSSDQGQWERALEIAESARRLDPHDPWIRFKLAGVLMALDRPADARAALEDMATSGQDSPLLAAQRERLLGRLALEGKAPNHRAAVEHFTESIRLAAPLLSKRSPPVQAAVREVLLDAHLGTALAIAEGTWQQKSRVIPKWITRGEAVVKDHPGSDQERQVLELQLCRGALAVAAASTESVEPLPWVKRLLELRDKISETVNDPWRRRQIDWDVGQGLTDAITAAQLRGDASDMLDNATLTAAYLERGAEHRELTDGERKQLGDLMFRIGILHSLQRGDHATAVTWFDRTIPLWNANDRFERDGDLGRLGESYVSMAISYWQVERREDALELSRRGVDLMVSSVDNGQLEERALAVAYGNLSTMYAEQGDDERSRSYAEMAGRAEAAANLIR